MQRRPRQPPARPDPRAPEDCAIDALYGLEPVFEPGVNPSPMAEAVSAFHSIQCPYCGERFDTLVDASGGDATYVEDCQVCCQPIEFELQVDAAGAFVGLSVRRS